MPINDTLLNDTFPLHNNSWQGAAAIAVAVFAFGSAYVPTRKFIVYDGIFLQFAMSIGILFTGFIVNVVKEFPTFQPYAAIGGSLWAIANTLSQRVITELGMAVGILLWMSTNCIIGWSIGRFGLFGIQKKKIENSTLNFLGLVALLLGSFFIAFIQKDSPKEQPIAEEKTESLPSILNQKQSKPNTDILINMFKLDKVTRKTANILLRKSERIMCIISALIAGFFYCVTLVPVFYLEERKDLFPNAPRTGVPYVFSHFFGVFMGSLIIYVFYTIVRLNKPLIDPQIVLPSIIGGIIWAVGMTSLIISNDLNGQTITYPLTTTLPGLLASVWSVFYFKEINSKRNYAFLFIAFVFIGTGAVMVFLSKIKL